MYIALNEVYFGKSKYLLECEKLFAEIKKDYDGRYYDSGKIELDSRLRQIERLLALQFGLKKVIFEVKSLPVANAGTPPISYGIDVLPTVRTKANLIVDDIGFKYKPEAGYIISIILYTGALCNPNLTPGELMAIIIHEIGHNFQSVIDHTNFMLTDVVQISRIILGVVANIISGKLDSAINMGLTPILHSSKFRDVIDNIETYLEQYELYQFLNYYNDLFLGVSDTVKLQINYFISSLLGYMNAANPYIYLQKAIEGLLKTALDPLGYRNERIADNFATAYGYGPELASGLMKLETINYEELPLNKLVNYITPIGIFLRTGIGLGTMVHAMFDPHPATIERCIDQIRYLRKEIDITGDREAKAILQQQIDAIENNLKKSIADPQLKKHWNIVSYTMSTIVYNSGGDIRHNVFGRNVHRNMQRTYDEKSDNNPKFRSPKMV